MFKTVKILRKRNKFLSAAGGWKEMKGIDTLKDDIYSARKISHREVKI